MVQTGTSLTAKNEPYDAYHDSGDARGELGECPECSWNIQKLLLNIGFQILLLLYCLDNSVARRLRLQPIVQPWIEPIIFGRDPHQRQDQTSCLRRCARRTGQVRRSAPKQQKRLPLGSVRLTLENLRCICQRLPLVRRRFHESLVVRGHKSTTNMPPRDPLSLMLASPLCHFWPIGPLNCDKMRHTNPICVAFMIKRRAHEGKTNRVGVSARDPGFFSVGVTTHTSTKMSHTKSGGIN